jgi:hypothetical protein
MKSRPGRIARGRTRAGGPRLVAGATGGAGSAAVGMSMSGAQQTSCSRASHQTSTPTPGRTSAKACGVGWRLAERTRSR